MVHWQLSHCAKSLGVRGQLETHSMGHGPRRGKLRLLTQWLPRRLLTVIA